MRRATLVFAVLLVTGCGGGEAMVDEESPSDEPLQSTEESVIVGEVNWKSTTLLTAGSAEARNAQAVGYLSIPAQGTRCTAWLVAKDKVITNNHCIASSAQAVGAKVSFNYLAGVSSSSRVWYSCSRFIRTWRDLDMTVLGCSARDGKYPGEVQGWLKLGGDASKGSRIYVVHQNCDYYGSPGCSPTKKYSPGAVVDASVGGFFGIIGANEFAYNADTLGGSSGSPVLSAGTHLVVGLHHVGEGDSNDDGRGTRNVGVRVSKLKSALASIGL